MAAHTIHLTDRDEALIDQYLHDNDKSFEQLVIEAVKGKIASDYFDIDAATAAAQNQPPSPRDTVTPTRGFFGWGA